MIRGLVIKAITYKPLYTFVYRLTYLTAFIGMLMVLFVQNMGEGNHIEEVAVHPQLLTSSQANDFLENFQKVHTQIRQAEKTHTYESVLDFIDTYFRNEHMLTQKHYFTVAQQGHPDKEEQGVNLIGVYHVPRSGNYECNLFTFDYSKYSQRYQNIAFSLSLLSIFRHQEVNYLSRNVMFLAYDGRFKKMGKAVREFLDDYFDSEKDLLRCGTFRQAINLDIATDSNAIVYKMFGINGRVPDRDYFLLFNKVLVQTKQKFYYTDGFTKAEKNFAVTFVQPIFQFMETIGVPKEYLRGSFSQLLNHLLASIQGSMDDAHSYLHEQGIQAITLRGVKAPSSDQTPESTIRNLALVVEASNSVNMSLDEQLHAGSTLYFPITEMQCVTVARYVFPIIIAALSLTLNNGYFVFQQDKYKQRHKQWITYIIHAMHSFFLILLPHVAQKVYGIVEGKEFEFDVQWRTFEDPNLDKYIMYYAAIGITSVIFTEFVVQRVLHERLFGKAEIKDTETLTLAMNMQRFNTQVYSSLCSIYWLFFNLGLAYIIVIVHTPIMMFLWPLKPQRGKAVDYAYTAINLALLSAYWYIGSAVFAEFDAVRAFKEMIIAYMTVGSQLYIFFATSIVQATIMIVRMYLWW